MVLEPNFPRAGQQCHQRHLGLILLGTGKHNTSSWSLVAGWGQLLVLANDTSCTHTKALNGQWETLGDSFPPALQLAAFTMIATPSAVSTGSLQTQDRHAPGARTELCAFKPPRLVCVILTITPLFFSHFLDP